MTKRHRTRKFAQQITGSRFLASSAIALVPGDLEGLALRAWFVSLEPTALTALVILAVTGCLALVGLAIRKLLGSNRRLHIAVRSEQARIRYLAETGERLSRTLDLDQVRRVLVEAADEVVGDAVRLIVADARTGLPAVVAEHGRTHEIPPPDDPTTARAMIVSELITESVLDGTASRMLVPLEAGGKRVALLDLWCLEQPELPDERERALAKMLADRAAPCLEHARLHGELTDLLHRQAHQLAETRRQLLEAERARAITELAGMVAHEIRNPLNVVKTSAFALQQRLRDEPDPRVKRHLELLNRHVDTATRIIQDLTDFGALPEPERARVDLGELARGLVRQMALPENVDLEVRVSPEALTVEVDGLQVTRALQTLLINAVQAASQGVRRGRVVLCAELQEGQAVVEIRDNGRGFAATETARVFDPYFSGETKATGLSLALCRKILEQNGGGIELETEPGVGSSFKAWLPLVVSPQSTMIEGGSHRERGFRPQKERNDQEAKA